ncbi:DNA adenine methylase [Phenylobacterium sp.]|uniref:DNA adenine methylase n=1 Tax=Phenylobacterium sp. TaxID=1871053 RepID=UPI00356A7158
MADGTSIRLKTPIVPPLKWAGGKRWLVNRLAPAISVPFVRLVEPFAGSAATFFALRPTSAILADTNRELINVYRQIKRDPSGIYEQLEIHAANHSRDYYYLMRSQEPNDFVGQASRTLYLNRTCWNALYRVNKQGKFNVPKGTKDSVLLKTDDFESVSEALSAADLRTADFARTIAMAGPGDLIFADPPYFSTSVAGTFVKYTNRCFSWPDQVRLARCITDAHRRGAHFILTNVDVQELERLYAGVGYVTRVARTSVISGKPSGRIKASELLWTSFPLEL